MNTTLSNVTLKIVAVIFLILSGLFIFSPSAQAQADIPSNTELDGYAWSSTIGWISFNCKTGGAGGADICGTSNYKVSLLTNGNFQGYAWSSNVGWIKFHSLSSFPTGSGTTASNAQVTGTFPDLTLVGWARACAGTTSGTCSTMVSRTDGWDGWISLAGTAPSYSILFDSTGGDLNDFAWGSNVVGWINFDGVLYDPAPITSSLTGVGCEIAQGASSCNGEFTWDIQGASDGNLYNSTQGNTYSSNDSGTSEYFPLDFGSNTVVVRDNSSVLRSDIVSATCVAGTDFTNGTTCESAAAVPPTISITTSRNFIRSGGTVSISWIISGLVDGNCSVSGPGLSLNSITTSGNQTSAPIRSASQYSIECSGSYPTVRATSGIVEVIPVAQEV